MNEAKTQSRPQIRVKELAMIALLTAVTCILAPLSIPIGEVPISLTNLVIYFSLYILGMKKGVLSYIVYLLIGFVGVPVFSGYTSGPQKLLGPTGGYLIGFLPMAVIAGLVIGRCYRKTVLCFLAMIAGTAVCYAFGTAWLAHVGGYSLKAALFAGVVPFIPGDLIKMGLAAVLGPQVRKQLVRAHLLED